MKRFSLLFIFLFIGQPSYGTSLVELQKNSLNNRQIIAQYLAILEQSSSDVTMARSGFFPSLDIAYTVNALDEKTSFEDKENSVAYGAVTWNLFSGFYDHYNLHSAQLLEKAQLYRLQAVKQDIQLNVALRYLDIYKQQSQLQVAEEAQATLIKTYEDSRNRYAVGLIEKNELLRFKVNLDNATINVKRAQAALAKGVQHLIFETDQDLSLSDLHFTEFDQLPVLDDQNSYHLKMLQNRSEIKTLSETNKAVALQIKATYASRYPRLDVTGSYRKYTNDYAPSDGNAYDQELRGAATLSLNLFDGFSKQATLSKAQSEKRSVTAQLTELQKRLQTELTNLFFDYEVNIANVAVSQMNTKQAEENLRITRLKYKEGLEQESDLLDAIANLSLIKNIHILARTEVFANYFKIIRTVETF